ncbi:hypothetical protein CDAR_268471 [Caerostris darwini]|uniref:Uncharacterized protein n=1 Tax=Caerostris darwini TaxID=1538125 RepID=A0AAV4P622_9ARAC|nr:hypothetical protein CDAR_268471 [Caerostris darwini]
MADSGSPAHVIGHLRQVKKKKEKRLTFQRAKWKNKLPVTPSREVTRKTALLRAKWIAKNIPLNLSAEEKILSTHQMVGNSVKINFDYNILDLPKDLNEYEKWMAEQLHLHTTKKPGTLNQVLEIPVVNSFTPLDQAADMQTDDSPTTQNKMHPVMVNIEDQNVKDITNLIGSEFGKRFILKLAPKHLKCTALDNQSYQDLITYLENNEFLQNYPQIDEVTQGGAERVTSS